METGFKHSRKYWRNWDISEQEDFEENVKPFINPGEKLKELMENSTPYYFCGVDTGDWNPVVVGWEVYRLFR